MRTILHFLKKMIYQFAAYAFSAAEWTNCSLIPLSSMAHRSTACFLLTFAVIKRTFSDGGSSPDLIIFDAPPMALGADMSGIYKISLPSNFSESERVGLARERVRGWSSGFHDNQ